MITGSFGTPPTKEVPRRELMTRLGLGLSVNDPSAPALVGTCDLNGDGYVPALECSLFSMYANV